MPETTPQTDVFTKKIIYEQGHGVDKYLIRWYIYINKKAPEGVLFHETGVKIYP
jgi:hypothetical protein